MGSFDSGTSAFAGEAPYAIEAASAITANKCAAAFDINSSQQLLSSANILFVGYATMLEFKRKKSISILIVFDQFGLGNAHMSAMVSP
jgi:hypothetical protein